MEFERTPKPDPIVFNKPVPAIEPEPVTPSVGTPIVPPKEEGIINTEKLKAYLKKNQQTIIVLLVFLLIFCVGVYMIFGNKGSSNNDKQDPVVSGAVNPTPVSKPVESKPVTDPSKNILDIEVSNGFQIKGHEYYQLNGSLEADKGVTLVKDSFNKVTIQKGESKLFIFGFHEEFSKGFNDVEFVGSTKSLGNMYRVSFRTGDTLQRVYFYTKPPQLSLNSACNTYGVSSIIPVDAPCGLVGQQNGFYFQCEGNLDFAFCDKVVRDIEFTVSTKVY